MALTGYPLLLVRLSSVLGYSEMILQAFCGLHGILWSSLVLEENIKMHPVYRQINVSSAACCHCSSPRFWFYDWSEI